MSIARILLNSGWLHFYTGSKDPLQGLEDAERRNPEWSWPPHQLGIIHYNRRDYVEAVRYFDRALSLGKKIDRFYPSSALFNAGKVEAAERLIEEAVPIMPWGFPSWIQHDLAALEESLKADPESAGKLLERAVCYGRLLVEKTMDRHPESIALLARLLDLSGERREAISTLEQASARLPEAREYFQVPLENLYRTCREQLPTHLAADWALANLDREPMIEEKTPWRFFPVSREPSPGLEWTEASFDDSSWELGAGVFQVANRENAPTALYLRNSFQVVDPDRYRGLRLSVTAGEGCDGFIVYLFLLPGER